MVDKYEVQWMVNFKTSHDFSHADSEMNCAITQEN